MHYSGHRRSLRLLGALVPVAVAMVAVSCVPPTTGPSGSTTTTTPATTTTVAAPLATTVTVTDNATTTPGGPPPVEYGGTIVFTATVSGSGATPAGSIHWSITGPDDDVPGSAVAAGVVPCADTPLIDGVATCSVTPGQYWDPGDEVWLDWIHPVSATAKYLPDASGTYLGSSGSDSTTKITGTGFSPAPQIPYIEVAGTVDLTMRATDALGRPLTFDWFCPPGVCDGLTGPSLDLNTELYSGLMTFSVASVCPTGIASPDISFECPRGVELPSITFKIVNQGI